MKSKARKALAKVFPYLFNAFLITIMLKGGVELKRVALFLMWMFGATNFVLGASLIAWYPRIAETAVKNRDTDKGNESWFKPTTNYMPAFMGLSTSLVAVAMGFTATAIAYGLGIALVFTGVELVKLELKDNH